MTNRRTRRVTAENATPINGEAPWADVVEDVTWGELKSLREQAPYVSASFDDAGRVIAPYVVAWNQQGWNPDTQQYESLPAPAEDAKVFDCVEPWVITWLFTTMHFIHQTDDAAKKKRTTSSDTPDGKPDPDSSSPRQESNPSAPLTMTS